MKPEAFPCLPVITALASPPELETRIRAIASGLTQTFQETTAILLLPITSAGGGWQVAAACKPGGEAVIGSPPVVPALHPLLTQATETRQQLNLERRHGREQMDVLGDLADSPASTCAMLQPLLHPQSVPAVLALVATGPTRRLFSDQERALCSDLAAPIAASIANARQYQQFRMDALALVRRLHDQQRQFMEQRDMLDSLEDGIVASDAGGQVGLVNAAAAEMLGADRRDLIGKPFSAVLKQVPMFGGRPDDSKQSSGHQVTFQLRDKTLQGCLSTITGKDGQFLGAVATLRDVTQIHQTERTREVFITTLSHELRTPLTALKGYIELFASGMMGPLSEAQRGFVQIIKRNADRMVDLVDSLIIAAQVQEGRGVPTHGHADLGQIINQVIRENGPIAAEQEVVLRAELADDILVIQADPIQVHLVISKLVSNGIKYTPSGGTVTVSARTQAGDAPPEEQYALVSVRDTGVGIPAEQQSQVFDRFFPASQDALDLAAGGGGIGLSMVKTLVEAHGGRIWVESTVGQGSTFTFVMPLERRGSLPWLLKNVDGLLHRSAT